MKTLLIFSFCIFLNSIGYSQLLISSDDVAPFNGDIAAVKKGDEWGFINKNGDLVIDYRNDYVLEKPNDYPVFYNNRCLIKRLINNVVQYGYIDTSGKEIIAPLYFNASNFKDGYAIVAVLLKDSIGYNKVMKMTISKYQIDEYVIDTSGKNIKYLENPLHYDAIRLQSKIPPKLRSKFIAPHLIAVFKKNQKWDIYKF
jgi:hypothetical protein